MSHSEHPLVRRFIEDAGNFSQSTGFGRAVGQIYAYLYFSPGPRTLDDMTAGLGISKGSASMNVRLLEQLGAVQRVWVKGDRKDYYIANDYFGQIIRKIFLDMIGKRLDSFGKLLAEAEAQMGNGAGNGGSSANPDARFLRERLKRLQSFHKKARKAWNSPILRMVLR